METLTEYRSIHDGPTIDAAVDRASEGGAIDASIQAKTNPNLLDNWYFGNPVNQRGQTSYTGSGYMIDRWYADEVVLAISSGAIRVSRSSVGQRYARIMQNLETELSKEIAGKTCTLSALVKSVSGIGQAHLSLFNISDNVSATNIYVDLTGGIDLITVTFVVPESYSGKSLGVFFYPDANDSHRSNGCDVYAIKLELGSQQTLAHQDADGNWVLNEIPDYGEQLRRCQRYFCRFNFGRNDLFFGSLSSNLDKAWITIPTPVVMRTAPSVSFSGAFNGVIRGNGFQLEFLASNSTVAADTSTTRCCNILITPNTKPSAWTAQQVVMIYTSSSWYMDCSADL